MRQLVLVAALALAQASPAQQPPATDVYLVDIGSGGKGGWINISNNPGYDNQPSFIDDDAILFSSDRGKGTDIYRYDISAKRLTQLTKTPEPEYSPLVTPDRKSFSVIRVEADADKTQRLWRFDLDGSNPRLVLENVKPVGYHAWIDATHLALFVLGSPATLQIADTATGTSKVVAAGIGRSIQIRPKSRTVTYTMARTPQTDAVPDPMIWELDPATGDQGRLLAPLSGSQDMAWRPTGELLMASGATVLTARTDATVWLPLLDMKVTNPDPSRPAIDRITRLAVSPNGRWLAFVAEPRTP